MKMNSDDQINVIESSAKAIINLGKRIKEEEEKNKNYKDILLKLAASLVLTEHSGDVAEDVCFALKEADLLELDSSNISFKTLRKELRKKGATTLYGTEI